MRGSLLANPNLRAVRLLVRVSSVTPCCFIRDTAIGWEGGIAVSNSASVVRLRFRCPPRWDHQGELIDLPLLSSLVETNSTVYCVLSCIWPSSRWRRRESKALADARLTFLCLAMIGLSNAAFGIAKNCWVCVDIFTVSDYYCRMFILGVSMKTSHLSIWALTRVCFCRSASQPLEVA